MMGLNQRNLQIDTSDRRPPPAPEGWQVKFDPSLMTYYYLNESTNTVQLDHPEEVYSPKPQDKKSFLGLALKRRPSKKETDKEALHKAHVLDRGTRKRTISLPVFMHKNDKRSQSPEQTPSNPELSSPDSPASAVSNNSSARLKQGENDLSEFQRLFSKEVESYEMDRLLSN